MEKKDVTTKITVKSFNGTSKEVLGTGLFAMVEKRDGVVTVQDGLVSLALLDMAVYEATEALIRVVGPVAGALAAIDAVRRAVDAIGSERALARQDSVYANSAAAELELEAMGDGE